MDTHELANAFASGIRAFRAGRPPTSNPNLEPTKARAWDQGFDFAGAIALPVAPSSWITTALSVP